MPIDRVAAAGHMTGRLLLVLVTLSLWSIPPAEAARSCAVQEHPVPGGADSWSERVETRGDARIVHLVQDAARNPFDRQRPDLSRGLGGFAELGGPYQATRKAAQEACEQFTGSAGRGKNLGEITVEAVPKEVKLEIGLLDGNPKFTGGLRLGRELRESGAQELVSKVRTERDGAVADGVSELLLRARVSGPGTVTCQVPQLEDGACRALGVGEADRRTYYAFAVYTPPDGFGPRPGRTRDVAVRFGFTARNGAPTLVSRVVRLGRPPVVLVHGTFSSKDAWRVFRTDSWMMGTGASMQTALESAGFQVFLVDYKATNNSHFETNKMAVWSNPGGIQEALEATRRAGLAAARADVVGHSMGGLLPRVYVNERRADYLRTENFGKGDIRRLITLCTTHYGSDIGRVALILKDEKVQDERIEDWATRRGATELTNWLVGLDQGATKDQIPETKALKRIGRTPSVPAHAIVCQALSPQVMASLEYRLLYRALAELFFRDQGKIMAEVFRHLERSEEHERLWDLIETVDWNPAQSWTEPNAWRVEPEKDNLILSLLRAAIFGNTPNDGVVRVESQRGGLKDPYVTLIRPVFHTHAQYHDGVQKNVVELLQERPGQKSRFDFAGFPPAGEALNNQPPGLRGQSVRERDEAIRASNMVRAHALAISDVAKRERVIILFRPVNPESTALIEADTSTKGMHVKGKSSNWGPQAGYIAADQAFSKILKDTKLDTEKKIKEIGNYNCEVKSSTERKPEAPEKVPDAEEKALIVPPGVQDYEVHKLRKEGSGPTAQDDCTKEAAATSQFVARLKDRLGRLLDSKGTEPKLFLYRASTRTYHDPKNPGRTLTPEGPTEPLMVLADYTTKKYLTADYDLLAIGTRTPREPLREEPDPERGFITPSQITLLDAVNAAVKAKGYGGGNVVHHGPENQFRCSPGTDFPLTSFEPDGSIRTIQQGPKKGTPEGGAAGKKDLHLKRYFQRRIALGWNLPPNQRGEWYLTPNPNWNWGRDRRERTRDQIKATGWPDEDGEPIKPPECK